MTFRAMTSGKWITIAAATWYDARAFAVRHFASLGEYVDTMSLQCWLENPQGPAKVELEWRGSDYAGTRQLWMRDKERSGRWRPWRLA